MHYSSTFNVQLPMPPRLERPRKAYMRITRGDPTSVSNPHLYSTYSSTWVFAYQILLAVNRLEA